MKEVMKSIMKLEDLTTIDQLTKFLPGYCRGPFLIVSAVTAWIEELTELPKSATPPVSG